MTVFGDVTPDAWSEVTGTGNQADARLLQMPETGTIDSIEVFAGGGDVNVKAVVWESDGHLELTQTPDVVVVDTTQGWKTLTFSVKPTCTGGSWYYFGFVVQYGITFHYTTTGAITNELWEMTTGNLNNYATPVALSGAGQENTKIGVRVNYTASGGGAKTVTADAGSLSLSGKELNLLHGGHGWLKYRKP